MSIDVIGNHPQSDPALVQFTCPACGRGDRAWPEELRRRVFCAAGREAGCSQAMRVRIPRRAPVLVLPT